MQLEGLKATKRWPLWGQITLALGGAMLLMSMLAGAYVRALETRYLLQALQTQSQRTFALLAAAMLDAVIAEDRPVVEYGRAAGSDAAACRLDAALFYEHLSAVDREHRPAGALAGALAPAQDQSTPRHAGGRRPHHATHGLGLPGVRPP